jgi:phosphohistidine phosphatase
MARRPISCNGTGQLSKDNKSPPGRRLVVKTLHLIRHAKSSAKEGDDHERTLSRRGRDSARLLGKYLPTLVGPIDFVLCSSALRTRETLDLVLAELSPKPRCAIADELYLASCEKLMHRLRRLDERDAHVVVIGHNPGLFDLAMALAQESSPNFRALASSKFPTSTCASFRVETDWSALGNARHEMTGYVTPDSLSDRKA